MANDFYPGARDEAMPARIGPAIGTLPPGTRMDAYPSALIIASDVRPNGQGERLPENSSLFTVGCQNPESDPMYPGCIMETALTDAWHEILVRHPNYRNLPASDYFKRIPREQIDERSRAQQMAEDRMLREFS